MSHRLSIYAVIMSVVFGLAFSSCHSSRQITTASSHGYTTKKGGGGKLSSGVSAPSLKGLDSTSATLLKEAESWVGTPYKYGGNDRGGVDCSGFVLQVYLRALDIKLPRTSREQSEFCQKVDKSHLTPGDLLFFRTTKGSDRISHVGIFVGENKMIHSSTSQGVIFTDLSTDYYVRSYSGAGKVGQYHAMLSRGKKNGGNKDTVKPEKKSEALPREIPTEVSLDDLDRVMTASSKGAPAGTAPAPSTATTSKPASEPEKSGGYTMTPVKSVPVRSTSTKPQTQAPATAVRAVTPAVSAASTTEPSVDDARNSVLNSIVEKDL